MTVLIAAALLFSQCKKDEQVYTSETEPISAQTIAATSATTTVPQPIDATKATSDGGYAWRIRSVAFGVTGDSGTNATASTVRIFENGVEIGPAHTPHTDIRTSGKGRFSHWGTDLYFSASDNSNPTTNGKKYTFLTTSGSLTTAAPTTQTPSTPDALSLSNLIGYANVGGKTTGGQGGSTITVTSFSALKSAAESSATLIIKVAGKITGTGSLYVKSNKTIIGVNGGTCEGFGFRVYDVSNIIFQNLTIRYVVNRNDDDCINIKNGNHVWVDHCDLYADRTHSDWEYYDGLIDISRQSDYITISWNKLHDSNKPVLIGADDSNTGDVGRNRVTLYKNYIYNVSERNPRVRFGYVHVFNNYMKNVSGYGVLSSMGATVAVEKNYFEGVSTPIRTDVGAKPGYISNLSTNKFVSSGSNKITTSTSTWTPASIYSYSAAVIAVDQVPSLVLAGAGPRN
ncbi:pectate lyase family protein [Desertivirga arenae]|uniref:pectate lyase family protein n=1 Tax=Desertivirga arenae TaxID=2810309 RepID=UPI001F620AE4|nr:pectate lyase [Pedobacter sp. SYSU D00823]